VVLQLVAAVGMDKPQASEPQASEPPLLVALLAEEGEPVVFALVRLPLP